MSEVTRDALPDDRELLVLHCEDSPARPGNAPLLGDVDFKLQFPLSDGRRLVLHCGPATHDAFVSMLAAYAADDADEQA